MAKSIRQEVAKPSTGSCMHELIESDSIGKIIRILVKLNISFQ